MPLSNAFPGALNSFGNPTESTQCDDSGFELDEVITQLQDAGESYEAKIGISESSAQDTPVAGTALWSVTNGSSKWMYPSLTPLKANLSADVNLNNTSNFFDGPSVSLTTGTWDLEGIVLVQDTAGIANIVAKLWDGTNVEHSTQHTLAASNYVSGLALKGRVTVTSTTTWKISVRDITSTSGKILAATVSAGSGNNASMLKATRVA